MLGCLLVHEYIVFFGVMYILYFSTAIGQLIVLIIFVMSVYILICPCCICCGLIGKEGAIKGYGFIL